MNPDAPRIIVGDNTFRIVRVDGRYVLELSDGADALGVERWREVVADGKPVRAMRDFLIRHYVKQEQDHAREG